MADIELVIKIPEAEYDLIVNDEACGLNALTRVIAKGTPLPKGHGDLIDRKELKARMFPCETIIEFLGRISEIDEVEAIIKADKTESEVNDAK